MSRKQYVPMQRVTKDVIGRSESAGYSVISFCPSNTWLMGKSLECLKELWSCAFHIRTVYVNSLDPNGIVWRLGNPQCRKW